MPIIQKTAAPKSSPIKRGPVTGGVLSRIQPMTIPDRGLKCLIYGDSGTGKTTFWATFPGPILAILCSGGRDTGELLSVDTPENRKKIHSVAIVETGEVLEVLAHVRETGAYKTIVLDHVSGLQDLRLSEILGLSTIPQVKNWGMAKQQEYGKCSTDTIEILRQFLSFPGNAVVIGQERIFGGRDDDMGDAIKATVGASVMPSIIRWLNPAVDYVLQTYKRPRTKEVTKTIAGKTITSTERLKGVEYCARTEPHEVYSTKFRRPKTHGALPECIVDPTYEKLIKLIDGK